MQNTHMRKHAILICMYAILAVSLLRHCMFTCPRTHIRRPPCTRARGAPGSLQAAHSRGRKKNTRKKIAPPLRRPEPNGRTGRPLPCTGRGSPPGRRCRSGTPRPRCSPGHAPAGSRASRRIPQNVTRHLPCTYPAPTLHLHLHRAHTAVTANRRPRRRRKGTGRLPCTYPAPAQSPSRATHGRPQPRRPSRKGTEIPTLHLAPGARQTADRGPGLELPEAPVRLAARASSRWEI